MELLHCCICPKRPSFSDTSHMLTHVSSKGHLAHLHKLQVRSHQELAAVQQLASYNQWFTDHDVAQLLSERMQQKEKKQAKRKTENKRRCKTAKREHDQNLDPKILSGSISSIARPYDAFDDIPDQCYSSNSIYQNDRDDTYPTPSLSSRYSIQSLLTSNTDAGSKLSSLRDLSEHPLWPFDLGELDDENPASLSASIRSTPEMARLKGTIWPGMDIFDSADAETQRKRNQRKDISVIEKMQSMSEAVEPMETVCSPGGTFKKQRHMDDLEEDSPVEGESPLVKALPKRKRKPLANISANVPHLTYRKSEAVRTIAKPIVTPTRPRLLQRRSMVLSRHSGVAMKPKFSVQNTTNHTTSRESNRPIFVHDNDRSLEGIAVTSPNLFINPFLQSPAGAIDTTYPSSSWLYQPQAANRAYDPFRDYKSSHFRSTMRSDYDNEKENMNPIGWSRVSTLDGAGLLDTYSGFESIDESEHFFEPPSFTKNPLNGSTINTLSTLAQSRNIFSMLHSESHGTYR